jgi:hypothetical protein
MPELVFREAAGEKSRVYFNSFPQRYGGPRLGARRIGARSRQPVVAQKVD